jgi:hypothetical protein
MPLLLAPLLARGARLNGWPARWLALTLFLGPAVLGDAVILVLAPHYFKPGVFLNDAELRFSHPTWLTVLRLPLFLASLALIAGGAVRLLRASDALLRSAARTESCAGTPRRRRGRS